MQLCGFRIGDEEYALDIMRIKEIINPLAITWKCARLRSSKASSSFAVRFCQWLICKRFDLPPLTAEQLEDYAVRRARKYLIVPIEGRLVGMIVDRVSDVLRVSRDAIRPPPLLTQNENARYFAGVCHHRGRILMVLDL